MKTVRSSWLPLLGFVLLTASAAHASELPEVANYDAVQREVRAARAPLRVVNLWATWCAPCVAEMSDLQKIADRFPHVSLIGVSLDDAIPGGTRQETKSKVLEFLRNNKVTFRNLYFTGRQSELADRFNFEGGLPMTFVYGADGKELARAAGRLDYDSFARKLTALEKRRKR